MSVTYAADVVEIGNQIAALSPSQAGELMDYLKEFYNMEPAFGPPQLETPPEKQPDKPQEQTEWSVILTGYDPNNKVGLVKSYREVSGKGLKESMDAIVATTTTPLVVREGISKAEAEKLKATLEAANGKVELK